MVKAEKGVLLRGSGPAMVVKRQSEHSAHLWVTDMSYRFK
jgi:hypothetical protein